MRSHKAYNSLLEQVTQKFRGRNPAKFLPQIAKSNLIEKTPQKASKSIDIKSSQHTFEPYNNNTNRSFETETEYVKLLHSREPSPKAVEIKTKPKVEEIYPISYPHFIEDKKMKPGSLTERKRENSLNYYIIDRDSSRGDVSRDLSRDRSLDSSIDPLTLKKRKTNEINLRQSKVDKLVYTKLYRQARIGFYHRIITEPIFENDKEEHSYIQWKREELENDLPKLEKYSWNADNSIDPQFLKKKVKKPKALDILLSELKEKEKKMRLEQNSNKSQNINNISAFLEQDPIKTSEINEKKRKEKETFDNLQKIKNLVGKFKRYKRNKYFK